MIKRQYYSVRAGKIPNQNISFEILKTMFLVIYNRLGADGYFQKYFGIYCVDGDQPGELGSNIEGVIFLNLKKDNLFPIEEHLSEYSEDDFFDILEFLHDHCSKGLTGYYHEFANCGYHYGEFSDQEGQRYFRETLNPILMQYKEGFEISENGEILILSDPGLSTLFEADIPTSDTENVKNKIDAAIVKFRAYKATLDTRREAVRELADVLEFLRPSLKKILVKNDENDLFNLANNFGVRHHNKDQKTDYDKSIWCSWMFYYYLATLHAVLRMINKKAGA